MRHLIALFLTFQALTMFYFPPNKPARSFHFQADADENIENFGVSVLYSISCGVATPLKYYYSTAEARDIEIGINMPDDELKLSKLPVLRISIHDSDYCIEVID